MTESRYASMEGGVWGLVVVIAAFMIQVLAFGTSQSIGIYNVEFLDYFNVGAAAVSLVGAINLGVFLGAGPVASFLMSQWSHRQVALLGASLTCIGLVVLPFTPNLVYMYVFFGAVSGLGNCLVYVPSHVLSGLYYTKHRSLATGVATAGSGLGSTIFPIILYHLIDYYGWKGSLFILTGLNLHLLIFAALLRPVPKSLQRSAKIVIDKDTGICSEEHCLLTNGKTTDTDQFQKQGNIEIPLHLMEDDLVDHRAEVQENSSSVRDENDERRVSVQNADSAVNFDCQKITPPGSNMSRQRMNGSVGGNRKMSMSKRLERHFSSFFKFKFVIFFFSNIFWNAGGAIILLFLPEYMISCGLSKEISSVVFTMMGAGSCIGCVIGGLLGNIHHIDRILLYITGNIGCGCVTLLQAWSMVHTVWGFGVLTFLSGFMFGIILGLLVVVTADLLGADALGDGFGYLMFANGIGVFSGPPIAGGLIDTFGDMTVGIYLSGVLTVMGGVMMCIVPVKKWLSPSKQETDP